MYTIAAGFGRFARLCVEAHRVGLRTADLLGTVEKEVRALAFEDLTDDADLFADEKFQAYCEIIAGCTETLSDPLKASQVDEVDMIRKIMPLVVTDEDMRSTELFSVAVDGAPDRAWQRNLPFDNWSELKEKSGYDRFSNWAMNEFKYLESHEKNNAFCRMKNLPRFLKPILGMLDDGKKAGMYGNLMKQILMESAPSLCASHVVNTLIGILGTQRLEDIAPFYVSCGWWREGDNNAFLKRAKSVTTALRKGVVPVGWPQLEGGDVTSWCYMEFYTGRAANRFDLEKELANRTKLTVPLKTQDREGSFTKEAFRTLFHATSKTVIETVPAPAKEDPVPLKTMFMNRAMWSSAGAGTHYAYASPELAERAAADPLGRDDAGIEERRRELKRGLKESGFSEEYMAEEKIKRRKLNKQASMEEISWHGFLSTLEAEEVHLVVSLIDKFENAKGRMIINGDDENYIAGQLLISCFENALHKFSWSGHATKSLEAMNQIAVLSQRLQGGFWLLCADWSDFNIHEAAEHMAALYALVGEWELRRRSSGDVEDVAVLMKVINFLTRACQNCVVSGSGELLVQGLPSGIRATDLFNTLFNRILCIIADSMIEECDMKPMGTEVLTTPGDRQLFRCEAETTSMAANSMHIGDDLVAWARTLWACATRLYGLVAMGCNMSAFKQQISRKKAEFLRRWITADTITAFPHRALGNMLSPPLQATDVPTPVSTLTSHYSEIAELGRRRANDLVITCSYAFAEYRASQTGPFRIPVAYPTLPQSRGGLGLIKMNHGCYRYYKRILGNLPELPRPREHPVHDIVHLSSYATDDLASRLHFIWAAFNLESLGLHLSRVVDDFRKVRCHINMQENDRKTQMKALLETKRDEWSLCNDYVATKHAPGTRLSGMALFARLQLVFSNAQNMMLSSDVLVKTYMRDYARRLGVDIQLVNSPSSRQPEILAKIVDLDGIACFEKHRLWIEGCAQNLAGIMENGVIPTGMIAPAVQEYDRISGGEKLLNMFGVARAMKIEESDALCIMLLVAAEIGVPEGMITPSDLIKVHNVYSVLKSWQLFEHFLGPSMMKLCYMVVASRVVSAMASRAHDDPRYAYDVGVLGEELILGLGLRLACVAGLTEIAFQ